MNVLVLGGYGVFGSIVCRQLAARGHVVTVAGRDGGRAHALAAQLVNARAAALDQRDGAALRRALEHHDALAGCAGPFTADTTRTALAACLEAGRHYADIADERASLRVVREHGARFAERGLTALRGCSSLPGLSAALALVAAEGAGAPPQRARVTLFIGNDNPKGAGAIASFLRQAGRPIAAPQGTLRAGGGCARVPFPPPVGARTACDFDGPEHDLLPELMGTGHVEAKVAFELGLASRAMSLLGRIVHGERTARWLSRMGALTRRLGTSAGAVMAELWWPDGSARSAALVAARNGQRMAALPCVLALDALGRGAGGAGALLPHELLGARPLLAALQAEGFALHESAPCP